MTMTAILRAFTLGTALLLATVAASRAADQTVTLRPGVKSTLMLDRAFDVVLIGDSNIIDVHDRDNRSVVLDPLAPGTTNLIFVDEQQMVIANIEVLVRQPAINLVGRLP
jgi:Flp pilus assembly secretin CpaC